MQKLILVVCMTLADLRFFAIFVLYGNVFLLLCVYSVNLICMTFLYCKLNLKFVFCLIHISLKDKKYDMYVRKQT